MAEQRRFEVGMRVKCIDDSPAFMSRLVPPKHGVINAVFPNIDGIRLEGHQMIWAWRRFEPADTSPTADPVVEQPKADRHPCAYKKHTGLSFHIKTLRCTGCGQTARELGLDPYETHRAALKEQLYANAYYGDAPLERSLRERSDRTQSSQSAHQRNIAALAAEHTRQADSIGLLHPKEFWSGRRGGRRNG